MKKTFTLLLAVMFLASLAPVHPVLANNCPAAPAVANKILQDAGIRGGGLYVSSVARNMGPRTDFGGVSDRCSRAYYDAVHKHLSNFIKDLPYKGKPKDDKDDEIDIDTKASKAEFKNNENGTGVLTITVLDKKGVGINGLKPADFSVKSDSGNSFTLSLSRFDLTGESKGKYTFLYSPTAKVDRTWEIYVKGRLIESELEVLVTFDDATEVNGSAIFTNKKDGTGVLTITVWDEEEDGIVGLKPADFKVKSSSGSSFDLGHSRFELTDKEDGKYVFLYSPNSEVDRKWDIYVKDVLIEKELHVVVTDKSVFEEVYLRSVVYKGTCDLFGSHVGDEMKFVFSDDITREGNIEIEFKNSQELLEVWGNPPMSWEIEGNELKVTVTKKFSNLRDIIGDEVIFISGLIDEEDNEVVIDDGVKVVGDIFGGGTVDADGSQADHSDNKDGTGTITVSVLDVCGNGVEGLKPEDFSATSSSGSSFNFAHERFELTGEGDEDKGKYVFLYSPNSEVDREWDIYVKDVLIEEDLHVVVTIEAESENSSVQTLSLASEGDRGDYEEASFQRLEEGEELRDRLNGGRFAGIRERVMKWMGLI